MSDNVVGNGGIVRKWFKTRYDDRVRWLMIITDGTIVRK